MKKNENELFNYQAQKRIQNSFKELGWSFPIRIKA